MLINIFGGIVRCDMVARGVVGAAKNLGINVPVVVRLEGTNVEEGQRVIRESGLNFTVANGMKDAAEKVVALAGERQNRELSSSPSGERTEVRVRSIASGRTGHR